MAKLTLTQAERQKQRELEKQKTLAKKREIQEKKAIFGEEWRKIEQAGIQNAVESEIGSSNTPKIYDFTDVYDFFNPVIMYKSSEGKILKMDLSQFKKSEDEFKKELDELNLIIDKFNSEDGIVKEEIEHDEKIDSNKDSSNDNLFEDDDSDAEKYFDEDGANESDNDSPLDQNNYDDFEKSGVIEDKSAGIKRSLIGIAKAKLNKVSSIYFDRFIPRYSKQICSCCGRPRNIKEYYVAYSITYNSNIDDSGARHLYICKECCSKLFNWLYTNVAEKDVELAMKYMCAYLNLYWDVDYFNVARKDFDDNGRKGTLIGSYIKTINKDIPGKTFMDSPFLEKGYSVVSYINSDETSYDWDKEDYNNKKIVLKMVGYDPFKMETDEDRKILYKDLLAILDVGMENDFTKLQAAIQIVQGFFKIRKMNDKITKMERDNAPISEIKSLSDLKQKEMVSVTNFARDNQFSTRYATAQAKGENTLTGILNKANEMKYEKSFVNRYDIETSDTIQQAANASFKAIFEQLNMGESEVWKTCQEQFEELTKLRRENSKLQEELRLAKYRVAEVNLLEKAREKELKDNALDGEE